MSESFYSDRFCKKVWLTNHAIEMMAKRKKNVQKFGNSQGQIET